MYTNFLMWNLMTTPLVYVMFKIGLKNKQYAISFEIATSSQTKLQFQNFPHAFSS
jgi:hypothetical protein